MKRKPAELRMSGVTSTGRVKPPESVAAASHTGQWFTGHRRSSNSLLGLLSRAQNTTPRRRAALKDSRWQPYNGDEWRRGELVEQDLCRTELVRKAEPDNARRLPEIHVDLSF
ncbi:unnamed protein product [Leptosia nina]|uniref:Uncharacterized protein n=1 Tax=Leptosia nina TaxID=320188 RepID=A0AAV1IS14_9NEOP